MFYGPKRVKALLKYAVRTRIEINLSSIHSHKPPLAKRLLAVEGYAYEVVSI